MDDTDGPVPDAPAPGHRPADRAAAPAADPQARRAGGADPGEAGCAAANEPQCGAALCHGVRRARTRELPRRHRRQ